MASYFIDEDQTVHRWELDPIGIRLGDGRLLIDGTSEHRQFSGHPDQNPLLSLVCGRWLYKGAPLAPLKENPESLAYEFGIELAKIGCDYNRALRYFKKHAVELTATVEECFTVGWQACGGIRNT